MKKLFTSFLLALFGVVYAVAQTYVLNKELTWDQVKGGTTAFALVSGDKVLYGSGDQNCGFADASTALLSTNAAITWKVESVSNGTMFHAYKPDGTSYSIWGGSMLNSNPGGGTIFILGTSGSNKDTSESWTGGQDMANGAIWTVSAVSGGYTIKNVGNNKYLAGTNATDAAVTWKFYSIKESNSSNIATNSSYPMGAIRQKGNQLVMVDDESKSVVLHGVMDTPSAYFQSGRWTNGVKWAAYTTSDITPCLNYFKKIFEAINTPSKGTYCNLFRLHLDPCWLQDDAITATGFTIHYKTNEQGQQVVDYVTDPHGSTVSGEANIVHFSKAKFEARLQDLYIPIIKDAIAHGLYVIIRPPGVFPQEIVVGDYYNEYLKTIWDIVSKDSYIKANAGYISLELGNEPVHIWGASADRTQAYWQYGNNHTDLYDFFQPIVNTIRNNGFDGIIWAPGTAYQAEYRGYSYKMLSDPKSNLGFAAHFYPGWYNTTSNDATCANTDANVLSTFKTQIPVQANYPIVITEVDWSPKDGAGGHNDEHGDWVVSNYGTWGTGSTTQNSRFGEQFKYVTDQCGNISYTIEGADLYVDMDKYLEDETIQPSFLAKAHANNVDIYEACSGAAFKWYKEYAGGEYEWTDSYVPESSSSSSETDLTKAMFHKWSAATANATISATDGGSEYVLNESTGQPYGTGSVWSLHYADISDYATLAVTTSAGEPRFMLNRDTDDGQAPDHMIAIPNNSDQTAAYETVVDNGDGTKTYNLNIAKIVEDKGYAHLNAIKGANYADVTVTSMKLIPVDKCLKVTTTEAKTNSWDWQIRYPLPTALETDKTYTIEMVAKAGAAVDIQPIAADNDSSNKDEWGGSADIQYLSASITTDWSTVSFETNGNYPYDYLYFNIGKVNGDLMISNIKITEKSSGTVVLDNNMSDNSTWTKTQDALTLATVPASESASGGSESSTNNELLTTQDDSETDKCTITQANGVTTYTTVSGGVNILFKNKNVDVTGYNQVKITFAEETDIALIFSAGSNVNVEISAHSKSFTYDIPSGKTTLDELTLVEAWQGSGKVVKISSIEFLNDDSNTKTITVDGTSRSYYLYIPDGVGENPALVFSLHGASGHSSDFSPFGKAEAAAKKCIVVYPQGLDQYFAVFGGNVPGWNATGENNEDIKFFKAIIEDVQNYHAIDTKRVYCCGFSNGGMMTYAAANAASDVFAAYAAISGFPMNEFHHRHAGASPRPFLHIQGKEDGFVKYEYMPYIRDNMVARLGANPIATSTTVTGKYTKNVYAAGTNGFPYVYYEIDGMGHSGYTSYTEDNNSTLTMWNFFNQYTLDSECDATLKWNPNLDKDGFTPAEHGWTVTDNKTFKYGDATPTANPNVSHSLQFEKGDYQLRFQTTGTAGNKITINLKNVDGTEVFTKEATVGQKQYISYNIPAYGEYTITITKANASDKFSTLGAYMTTEAWDGATEVGEETEPTIATVSDLTADMFHKWSAVTADATISATDGGGEYVLNTSTDQPYGTGSVWSLHYADISNYTTLAVTVSDGEPRFMLNRDSDDGQAPDHMIAIPNDANQKAAYETVVDNTDGTKTYTIDLEKVVAEYGYAHLNAIKGANWAKTTVTSMKLIKRDYEEFDFAEFAADGSATWNLDNHSLTGGTGGWTFSSGKDVSAYRYLVITSAQNRKECSSSCEVEISDGTNTFSGEGGEGYTANGAKFWLDNWNHNSILAIDIQKLKEGQFDITHLTSLKFKGISTDQLYLNNVYVTNTLLNYTAGDYVKEVASGGVYGTICLPYPAACSGAVVYEISGQKNGTLYINSVDGLMEAGKAYMYCSVQNYEGNNDGHKVLFYKASSIEVTTPVVNNGMIGTFEKISAPQGSYILKNNSLYEVNSKVNVGANRAYIDMDKVPALTSVNNARMIPFYTEDDDATAIESVMGADSEVYPVAFYNLSGFRIDQPQKGINIVKMSNNTVKKIIVK